MAMVYVGQIAAYRRTRSPGRLVWSEARFPSKRNASDCVSMETGLEGRQPSVAAGLHTSDESDELSQ